MSLERTVTQIVPKPWGSTDLRPWYSHHEDAEAIGEVWFQRADLRVQSPALLVKILFTTEPLSIQVHPDDAFAHAVGLASGKSEAWYILSALPEARIALGLRRPVAAQELREAIDSGAIADLVQWRGVKAGDLIFVPAGTIHAVGAGLVLVEIQQRSDVTYRLFDYGRPRALHPDSAVAAARGEQATRQAPLRKLSKERTLLVASRHFVVEFLELMPGSRWQLRAGQETWLFVIGGGARIGALDTSANETLFLEAESAQVRVRSNGLRALLAYVGSSPVPELLHRLDADCIGIREPERDQHHHSAGPRAQSIIEQPRA